MIIAPVSQFYVYLQWGQCLFSFNSVLNVKAVVGAFNRRRHRRGLRCDNTNLRVSCEPSFQALVRCGEPLEPGAVAGLGWAGTRWRCRHDAATTTSSSTGQLGSCFHPVSHFSQQAINMHNINSLIMDKKCSKHVSCKEARSILLVTPDNKNHAPEQHQSGQHGLSPLATGRQQILLRPLFW